MSFFQSILSHRTVDPQGKNIYYTDKGDFPVILAVKRRLTTTWFKTQFAELYRNVWYALNHPITLFSKIDTPKRKKKKFVSTEFNTPLHYCYLGVDDKRYFREVTKTVLDLRPNTENGTIIYYEEDSGCLFEYDPYAGIMYMYYFNPAWYMNRRGWVSNGLSHTFAAHAIMDLELDMKEELQEQIMSEVAKEHGLSEMTRMRTLDGGFVICEKRIPVQTDVVSEDQIYARTRIGSQSYKWYGKPLITEVTTPKGLRIVNLEIWFAKVNECMKSINYFRFSHLFVFWLFVQSDYSNYLSTPMGSLFKSCLLFMYTVIFQFYS